MISGDEISEKRETVGFLDIFDFWELELAIFEEWGVMDVG